MRKIADESLAARAAISSTRAKMKRLAVRLLMITADRTRRAWWFLRRPQLYGVLGVPVTPEQELVLIRISYTRGWHFPGGGMRRGETPVMAVVRELTEEIGLTGWRAIEEVGAFDQQLGFARDHVTVFAVYGARYTQAASLEVEAVRVFSLNDFPPDATAEVKSWAERALRRACQARPPTASSLVNELD